MREAVESHPELLNPGALMPAPNASDPDPRYRWYVLGVLMLVYTVHYIDRSVVNAVLEPIKAEFGVSDAALGWLGQFGDPYQLSVVDTDGRVGIDYGVYGVPETFVIDKAGVIRFKQIGPITEDAWRNKILPLVQQLQKS